MFVRGMVYEVHQASVTVCHIDSEPNQFFQHSFERQIRTYDITDLV